jgi:hypothetical protein
MTCFRIRGLHTQQGMGNSVHHGHNMVSFTMSYFRVISLNLLDSSKFGLNLACPIIFRGGLFIGGRNGFK